MNDESRTARPEAATGSAPGLIGHRSSVIVCVQLFAAAREIAGADSLAVELPPHVTVAHLRRELAQRVPALAGLLAKSALAVNHDFAEDDDRIQSGDEVAMIPPVSGG